MLLGWRDPVEGIFEVRRDQANHGPSVADRCGRKADAGVLCLAVVDQIEPAPGGVPEHPHTRALGHLAGPFPCRPSAAVEECVE
jgi:hypothetical protein